MFYYIQNAYSIKLEVKSLNNDFMNLSCTPSMYGFSWASKKRHVTYAEIEVTFAARSCRSTALIIT